MQQLRVPRRCYAARTSFAGIIFVVKGESGVGITEHVVFNVTLVLLTVQVSKLWIF